MHRSKHWQPTYERLTDNLKKIEGLHPVDEERQKMIDELVKVTTEDNKSKRFMSIVIKTGQSVVLEISPKYYSTWDYSKE